MAEDALEVRLRLRGEPINPRLNEPGPSSPSLPEEAALFDAEQWLCSWCATLNLGGQCCHNAKCCRSRATVGVETSAPRARKAPQRFMGSPRRRPDTAALPPTKKRVRREDPQPQLSLRIACAAAAREAIVDARLPLAALPAIYRVVTNPDVQRVAQAAPATALQAAPLSPRTAQEALQHSLLADIVQTSRMPSPDALPPPMSDASRGPVLAPKFAFKHMHAAMRERSIAGSPLRPRDASTNRR